MVLAPLCRLAFALAGASPRASYVLLTARMDLLAMGAWFALLRKDDRPRFEKIGRLALPAAALAGMWPRAAEQKKKLMDPAARQELVAAEARMKRRDSTFQGGGAATTDPRQSDCGNLFALKGVDWDDPTIDQLAKQRGQHPVEVMIDLSLADENQIKQLAEENSRLKKQVAELSLDKAVLQDVLAKQFPGPRS
jgi:hypothetical protein